MKRLMIDMDNCITDAYFMERINEYLNTNYKLNDQKDFYLQNLISKEKKGGFWNYMTTHTFYGDCPLLKDCYETLKILNQKYKLYIATAYLYEESNPDISGINLKEKYDYLKKYLPFISPKQYIFISDKNLIHSDIAIDDRICNLENSDKKLLMTAWHNKDIDDKELEKKGIKRVNTWMEILKELEGEE